MQKQYKTAELSIVHIAAQDIIVTSPQMEENSRSVANFGNSWSSMSEGTVIGYGED